MADHRIGLHTVGAPQRRQRQLHPDQNRLDPDRALHRLTVGENIAQREPELVDEVRLQLRDGVGECRLVGQQLPRHPHPLGALARVHEHRPGAAPALMRSDHPGAGLPGRQCPQAGDRLVAVGRADRAERGVVGAVVVERVGDVGHRHLGPGATHPVGQRRGQLGHPLGALAAHHQGGHGRCRDLQWRRRARAPAPGRRVRSCRRSRTTRRPHGADVRSRATRSARPPPSAAVRRTGCADWEHRSAGWGGSSPACTASVALMSPTMPAAASRWPRFDFTAPASSGASGCRPRP